MWPVTDHNFNTGSYNAYQQGHFLTRPMMKWFWDAYTKNEAQRNEIYASPLREHRAVEGPAARADSGRAVRRAA